ncbi:winged helix-turn-helix transcriptional regulator [Steroidobacter sp. S1-65]|uniref:Winged helix-turn-helix transcriptional regulator n=1 Tax=Steroidobacter gossypii TaxID=2805490 RepID=A0ABS1WW99_9GAMM|nr:metalloregulator ArsR/SmtB family transcription factor [Steroidobacter gossypii]MBM0105261.1 winged helix-turn-helix transcriptional regulator [Steroidobacter gossypii]
MSIFAALADPTRRGIVESLARGALSSGEIAERFDISASAISQHLKVLREAQVVRVRAEAQRRIYELDPHGVAELSRWVEELKGFWAPRFDALEAELRKPAGRPRKRRKEK